ncbi:MAG: hypothetical protein JOZ10_05160 [Acidobacteria bacterium]|nr:hypothetical protein [Acidobacteriota bacterium]MBV9146747.1 hypothetical protein [Acidobacteriota bacterium]MBV9438246.1 hypothetical protein [Acidobacteriota bacterium]
MTYSRSQKPEPLSLRQPAARVDELIASSFAEDLVAAAGNGLLNEDLALTLLKRRDVPAHALEALARNHNVMKHRSVLVQLAEHPRTPRHVSLPLLRRLFVFELMQIALSPAVAADLKLLAEETLIGKLETISLGESINLARRCSAAVAGALLLRGERQAIEAALQNPRMTETAILKILGKPDVPVMLPSMLMEHPKWSLRPELQLAVLRRVETPEVLVRRIVSKMPKASVLDLIENARLPEGREALLRGLLSDA